MNLSDWIINLLRVKWNLLLLVCFSITAVYIYTFSFFPSSKPWQKINLAVSGFNLLKFFCAIYSVIYFSMVLYNWWFFDKVSLPLAYQYLITVIIFIFISVGFAILNYILHLLRKEAFIYNADIIKYIINQNKTDEHANKKIEALIHEIDELKTFMELISENISVKIYKDDLAKSILSHLTIDNLNRYSILLSNSLTISQINQTNNYLISSMIAIPHSGITNHHYLLLNQKIIHFENVSVWNNSYYAEGQSVINFINERVRFLEDIKLPFWNDYKLQPTLPITLFIQASLMELLGLKQNYITPLSSIARVLYSVFGVYKFLLFGTFISLLLKK